MLNTKVKQKDEHSYGFFLNQKYCDNVEMFAQLRRLLSESALLFTPNKTVSGSFLPVLGILSYHRAGLFAGPQSYHKGLMPKK